MEDKPVKNLSQASGTVPTELQKLKLILDVVKWLVGSVALVIMTTIINYGFRDRAAGLKEQNEYARYVTSYIVLNKEVGPRRLLAQYFSMVTPSDKLRKCWEDYYRVVNSEYQATMKEDSLLNIRMKKFMTMKALNPEEQVEAAELAKRKEYTEHELNAGLTVPQNN